jgi:hypothetical protein
VWFVKPNEPRLVAVEWFNATWENGELPILYHDNVRVGSTFTAADPSR